MAVLGKRKARPPPEEDGAAPQRNALDVFRRHFEARFEPLTPGRGPSSAEPELGGVGDDDDDGSEWGGLSDGDDRELGE